MSFRNIESVPFPAVTVCAPNSGKWSAISEALHHFDKDEFIFEIFKNWTSQSKFIRTGILLPSFYGDFKQDFIKYQYDPSLSLDHDLPARLNLLPIGKENGTQNRDGATVNCQVVLMPSSCAYLNFRCRLALKS